MDEEPRVLVRGLRHLQRGSRRQIARELQLNIVLSIPLRVAKNDSGICVRRLCHELDRAVSVRWSNQRTSKGSQRIGLDLGRGQRCTTAVYQADRYPNSTNGCMLNILGGHSIGLVD